MKEKRTAPPAVGSTSVLVSLGVDYHRWYDLHIYKSKRWSNW